MLLEGLWWAFGGSVKLQTETTLEIIMVTEDLVGVLVGKPLESVEVTVHNGIVIATKILVSIILI